MSGFHPQNTKDQVSKHELPVIQEDASNNALKFIAQFDNTLSTVNTPLMEATEPQRSLNYCELSSTQLDSALYQLQKAQITYIQDEHCQLNFTQRDIRPHLLTIINTLPSNSTLSITASQQLDVVGYIFKLCTYNTNIQSDLRSHLLTLQSFYSRIALKLPAFLHKNNHVTRILLMDLIELAEQLSQSSHSNYHEPMLHVLKDTVFQINATRNITLAKIKHLHSLFHKNLHCNASQSSQKNPIQTLNTPTKKAQHLVNDLITTRMHNYSYDSLILKLIKEAWFQYLMLTYLQKGPKSKAWKNGLSTLDTLLWCARTTEHDSGSAKEHWACCVLQVRRKLFICLSEIRFNEGKLNRLMDNFDQYFAHQKHSTALID